MPSVIRAAKIGDAAIIKSIIKILNNEGIRVISSIFFNPELSLKKGNYSKLKPNKQDLRMDLPTVGWHTFKDIKKYGLRGVVLQSKKNIFLDKIKCIKFANKNKIFINIIWKKYSYSQVNLLEIN